MQATETTAVALNDSQKLIPFMFKQYPVRVMTDEAGIPWFVAKDICAVLEIVNSRRAIANLDSDEKGVQIMNTPGGDQSIGIINESGFYKLVLRSRKVEAKDFQRWVTHEILPSLRKTGAYSLNSEVDFTGTVKELVSTVRELGNLVKDLLSDKIKKSLPLVPNVATRLQISQVIRKFVARQTSGYSHQDAFDQLYYQFKYRFNIDLVLRARNAKFSNVLDYAEAHGFIDQLYSLAVVIFPES
jgi:prophage antirepressor-like protein